jgi:hypothetical protein
MFLTANQCCGHPENLLFWLEVRNFKKRMEAKDPSGAREARVIVRRYILPGSPMEINVSVLLVWVSAQELVHNRFIFSLRPQNACRFRAVFLMRSLCPS